METLTRIGSRKMKPRGFTLIELLVVMGILAVLLSIVVPRYFATVDRARESALRADLRGIREAIDKYLADTGKLPVSLDDLVDKRYLRNIPADPITESPTTWIYIAHPDKLTTGIYDVKSGSARQASDGTQYSDW